MPAPASRLPKKEVINHRNSTVRTKRKPHVARSQFADNAYDQSRQWRITTHALFSRRQFLVDFATRSNDADYFAQQREPAS
jgi:hypothetical protein